MKVLGIETSCDETSAAVVVSGQEILSNVIATQIPVHAKYGGVVPELASRNHVVDIIPVVEEALSVAKLKLSDIDVFAVTSGPGLTGALLVGIEAAKGLAWATQRPLVKVHHIEAHLIAPTIEVDEGFEKPKFPFIGLAVSGGHTSLVRVDGFGAFKLLSSTLDDAAGEALDKIGKMLGLGYPGGIEIDRLSEGGDPKAWRFPQALRRRNNLSFSFSGFKTSVRTHILKLPEIPTGQALSDLCASAQEAVAEILVYKTLQAAEAEGIDQVVISGGVSANRRLRALMFEKTQAKGIAFAVPPRKLCTDNAAMIAGLGFHNFNRGLAGATFDGFAINARSNWSIGSP